MEPCFGYKNYRCAILSDGAGGQMIAAGKCNTIACPFYKPDQLVMRVGDEFKSYSSDQLRTFKLSR